MKKIGKFSFVDTAAGQYALHMDWSSSMSQLFDLGGRNWDDDPVSVAGERVVRCRNCSTSAGGTGTMTR